MWKLLSAQTAVQIAQLSLLRFGHWPPVCAVSQLQDSFDVTRLRVDETLPERSGARQDRLSKWFKRGWIGVLRRILPQLLKDIHHGDRIAADVMKLIPQSIELRL